MPSEHRVRPLYFTGLKLHFSEVKTSDYLSSGEIILDFVTDNKYYFTGNIAPAGKAPLQVFYLLARETGQLFLTASGPIGLVVDKMLSVG